MRVRKTVSSATQRSNVEHAQRGSRAPRASRQFPAQIPFLRKTWETTAVLQNMRKICPGNVLRHLENETKVGEKGKLKLFRGESLCNPTQVYIFLDGFSQPYFLNITLHSFVFSWNCSMTKMLQTWTWQLWELKAWLLKRPPHHLTLILGFTFFLIRGMLSYSVMHLYELRPGHWRSLWQPLINY